jgi:hypothetical protein
VIGLAADAAVERENAAYIGPAPYAVAEISRYHVAIYAGNLVDHDVNGVALSQRVYEIS